MCGINYAPGTIFTIWNPAENKASQKVYILDLNRFNKLVNSIISGSKDCSMNVGNVVESE